ncbi:hypothetical protein EZS27_009973 [termite gut metagenome]|uniref:Uncharacterized protein n=1 Tax=termite gut metagenome TaxID=433724 RepID=A0A5J4SAG9_9ZZZZ
MTKKENKIMVIVSEDVKQRETMMRYLIVKLGFARIPSDAAKIINKDIRFIDISTAYFVFCTNYNFRVSPITNQRLYELAARGIAIVLAVRRLPREYEIMSQPFYPSDLGL